MKRVARCVRVAVMLLACVSGAQALEMQWVTVGDPGNTPDDEVMIDDTTGYGGVAYTYNIGTFEVTAGQYTEFLNAVADDDTYGLYNTSMWSNSYGCKIERTGSSPNYSYSVAPDWAERPVNYVSWGDVARFCNWLHNGQPTGAQDLTTTEDGSYYLNGAITRLELMAVVTREPDATWVIPSEDEWYKAAYYKGGGTDAGYWDYPTQSDTVPDRLCCDDGTNSANHDCADIGTDDDEEYACGPPYYTNEVGCYSLSTSAWGTFDQGGNVWEWNEAVTSSIQRGARGGAFWHACGGPNVDLHAADRGRLPPEIEDFDVGFRVALTPVCDDGTCEGYENPCNCPEDCGDPPMSENICSNGIDDDCDGLADCADPDCGSSYPCTVPTTSTWGVIVMMLLVLTAGTIVCRRRRAVAA